MCTAINLRKSCHYFGRNLDLEYHYNEEVVIAPENFTFNFRYTESADIHIPIIGMATIVDGIPLYYDAVNMHGLAAAGLNFPGNAVYQSKGDAGDNVAPFELIPWILRQCESVEEVRALLEHTNIVNMSFNKDLPNTPLHWIVSDSKESIVIEPVADGLLIYGNPIDVLTNNPPFNYHMHNLCNYLNLTRFSPQGDMSKIPALKPYSNGMGGIGLPGDLSSASRFVRAAYLLSNAVCEDTESSCISQFFHILDAVAHVRGAVVVNDKYEITYYSCCCNATKGIYYYKTYDNARISAIDMHKSDLSGSNLVRYPLKDTQDIFWVNH